MTINERLDRIVEKADLLPNASVGWNGCQSRIKIHVCVWCKPEGDVENKLANLIRRVAEEMEVTRL